MSASEQYLTFIAIGHLFLPLYLLYHFRHLSKLLKVTICFVMSVRHFVRNKQVGFRYVNFYDI